MRLRAQAPDGRRWVVSRRVVSWKPRLVARWLIDDLPLKGTSAGARPDVTAGLRTATDVEAAQTRGLVYGSSMVLVELPLLVLQAVAWVLSAVGTLVFKTVARKAWTITAFSEYPEPRRFEEQVTGWRPSRQRAHALVAELEGGTATSPASRDA
jgi:hypothetical protein